MLLRREKDNTFYQFSLFGNKVSGNIGLQTLKKTVLEPQCDKFTRSYVERFLIIRL